MKWDRSWMRVMRLDGKWDRMWHLKTNFNGMG